MICILDDNCFFYGVFFCNKISLDAYRFGTTKTVLRNSYCQTIPLVLQFVFTDP